MTVRVGINGFGRIGRQSLKALIERAPDVEVVAVNDLVDARPTRSCSSTTRPTAPTRARSATPTTRSSSTAARSRSSRSRTRRQLPWGDLGVDIVVESTGIFTDADEGRAPTSRPARRRSSSRAPAKNEDVTIVLGVNEDNYDPASHHIISNASCTTNCLAPAAKVVHDRWTIKRGLMNTIHSYTNDQRILDVAHKDPRRARAAGLNIIPTTTGAAKALALVIPDLKGKFDGFSLRVPTPTVSVVDFTAELDKDVTLEELNARVPRGGRGTAQGHPRRERRAARLDRLPRRLPLLDHRPRLEHGPGRQLREGHRLVRQRVGLQLPRRRPDEVRRGPARLTTA